MWFAEVLQTKPHWFDSKLWQLFKGLLPFCCLALFMTQDSYRANVSFCTGLAWRTCCLSHMESLYKCCEAFVIFSSGAKVLIHVFFFHISLPRECLWISSDYPLFSEFEPWVQIQWGRRGATVVSTVTKKVMGQILTLAILCGGIFLHFSLVPAWVLCVVSGFLPH